MSDQPNPARPDQSAEIAGLRRQRDALLAALKGLVKVNEEHNGDIERIIGRPPHWNDEYLSAARAAIADAEGGGTCQRMD